MSKCNAVQSLPQVIAAGLMRTFAAAVAATVVIAAVVDQAMPVETLLGDWSPGVLCDIDDNFD